MKLLTLLIGMAVILVVVMAAQAQTAGQKPTFDVASIKPDNTTGPSRVAFELDASKGRFMLVNATVRTLLRYAFDRNLPENEQLRAGTLFSNGSGISIIGGPGWIANDRFDVEAKTSSNHSQPEMQSMAQALLEDRFQLKWHYETRDMPVYNLVVVKEGRMKLSADQDPASTAVSPSPVPSVPLRRGAITAVSMEPRGPSGLILHMIGNAAPMPALVNMLEGWANRPVFDKTGLKGLFDIHVPFSSEATSGAWILPTNETRAAGAPDTGVSLFTAIQEELGLKLESSKAPLEVLVIDSIQKPTEN
jgi:uncharacterized protein (TIGR03435 family)